MNRIIILWFGYVQEYVLVSWTAGPEKGNRTANQTITSFPREKAEGLLTPPLPFFAHFKSVFSGLPPQPCQPHQTRTEKEHGSWFGDGSPLLDTKVVIESMATWYWLYDLKYCSLSLRIYFIVLQIFPCVFSDRRYPLNLSRFWLQTLLKRYGIDFTWLLSMNILSIN